MREMRGSRTERCDRISRNQAAEALQERHVASGTWYSSAAPRR
jgi:hypothetical protein